MGLNKNILILLTIIVMSSCGETSSPENSARQSITLNAADQETLDKLVSDARALTIMVDPEKTRIAFKNMFDFVGETYPHTSRRYAVALNDYGAILNITGSPKQALPYHEQAVALFTDFGTDTPKSADDLSRALANLAQTQVRLNRLDTGKATYQRAYDIAETGLSSRPADFANGVFPILIAANWREFFTEKPDDIFVRSDFTESEDARAKANRVDRFARAQDLAKDPDGAYDAWMAVLPAMQAAYPARSRKVLIATGNRGAVLGYFGKNDQAKILQNINIEGSIFYGAEILEDAENMSRKLGNRGWASARLNQMQKAEQDFIRAHKIVVEKFPPVNNDLGETHRALAHIARWRGDYAAAISHANASVAANQAAYGDDNNYTQNAFLDLSRTYSAAGLPKLAEATAQEALEKSLAHFGAQHMSTIILQAQIATELSRQGRYKQAKDIYEQALRALGQMQGEKKAIMVDMMAQSASNLAAMGKTSAAITIAKKAVTLGAKTGGAGSSYHTNALHALNLAYFGAGQFEDALKITDQIIEIYRRDDQKQYVQTLVQAQARKAQILHRLGRNQEAFALIAEQTLKQFEAGQSGTQAYQLNKILEADISASLGRAQGALFAAWPYANAISKDATRRRAMSAGLAQDAVLYRTAFENMLNISVLAGDNDQALWAADQLLQSSAGRARMQAARRANILNEDQRTALRTQSDLAARLTVAQISYAKMVTRDPERSKTLAADIKNLEREFQNFSKKTSFDTALDAQTKPLSLKNIRANLDRDEAVLLLVEGPRFLHTFVITKKQFRVSRAAISPKDLHDNISALRVSLSAQNWLTRGPAIDALEARSKFSSEYAYTLYQAVFTPDVEAVLADISHIKVAANGAFSRLPLSVLVRSKPTHDFKTEDWLIKRWQVSVLASPRSVMTNKRRKNRNSKGGLLAVGAPILSAQNPLPSLPGSRREIETVSKIFDAKISTLLLGADADETKLAALDLRTFNTLLFSTHGLVSGEILNMGEPALVLTPPRKTSPNNDGFLSASEISRLDLRADWVILSACNTAAGDSDTAPGLTGLARAFLYAGADSLLVSHWPVRDDAAAFLTVNTLENAQAGMDKAEALQHAIFNLMKSDLQDAANPSVWAPFVLVGG